MRYYVVRVYREVPDPRGDRVPIGVIEDSRGELHRFHGFEELVDVLKADADETPLSAE